MVANGNCHFAVLSRRLNRIEQDVAQYFLVEPPVSTYPLRDKIGLNDCDFRNALMR